MTALTWQDILNILQCEKLYLCVKGTISFNVEDKKDADFIREGSGKSMDSRLARNRLIFGCYAISNRCLL